MKRILGWSVFLTRNSQQSAYVLYASSVYWEGRNSVDRNNTNVALLLFIFIALGYPHHCALIRNIIKECILMEGSSIQIKMCLLYRYVSTLDKLFSIFLTLQVRLHVLDAFMGDSSRITAQDCTWDCTWECTLNSGTPLMSSQTAAGLWADKGEYAIVHPKHWTEV